MLLRKESGSKALFKKELEAERRLVEFINSVRKLCHGHVHYELALAPVDVPLLQCQ